MEYDDDKELTSYVWNFHGDLMTEFEWRVGWGAYFAEGKDAIGHPEVAKFILRTRCITGDPAAEAALADGVEAFRRRVRCRVMAERGSEVFINRCPACVRVVRTPKARQCLWCGCDWHDSDEAV